MKYQSCKPDGYLLEGTTVPLTFTQRCCLIQLTVTFLQGQFAASVDKKKLIICHTHTLDTTV